MGTGAAGSAAILDTRGIGGFETCADLPDGSRQPCCRHIAETTLHLKELGHRVRNSLTVIASLACMESEGIEDAVAAASIERLKNRVAATALLYDRLDLEAGSSSIRVDQYLEEIVKLVVDSLSLAPGSVELRMELSPLRLGPKQAGALGLITNEAVTNAFKYGILAGGGRTLRVVLGPLGRRFRRLLVEDDGPGFPGGFDPKTHGDFGLELMVAEAEGLGGALTATNGRPGARIEVVFPVGPERKPRGRA